MSQAYYVKGTKSKQVCDMGNPFKKNLLLQNTDYYDK